MISSSSSVVRVSFEKNDRFGYAIPTLVLPLPRTYEQIQSDTITHMTPYTRNKEISFDRPLCDVQYYLVNQTTRGQVRIVSLTDPLDVDEGEYTRDGNTVEINVIVKFDVTRVFTIDKYVSWIRHTARNETTSNWKNRNSAFLAEFDNITVDAASQLLACHFQLLVRTKHKKTPIPTQHADELMDWVREMKFPVRFEEDLSSECYAFIESLDNTPARMKNAEIAIQITDKYLKHLEKDRLGMGLILQAQKKEYSDARREHLIDLEKSVKGLKRKIEEEEEEEKEEATKKKKKARKDDDEEEEEEEKSVQPVPLLRNHPYGSPEAIAAAIAAAPAAAEAVAAAAAAPPAPAPFLDPAKYAPNGMKWRHVYERRTYD